ncbi:hypothetical protein AFCA_008533 [Aspergillus flavus]|nr:hypothetical protein AFCA_008533 [Aspergillus flavus]
MQRSIPSMIGGIHCRPALNEIAEEIELVPMANKIMQRGTTVDRSGVVYSDLLQHPVDQIEVQKLVLRGGSVDAEGCDPQDHSCERRLHEQARAGVQRTRGCSRSLGSRGEGPRGGELSRWPGRPRPVGSLSPNGQSRGMPCDRVNAQCSGSRPLLSIAFTMAVRSTPPQWSSNARSDEASPALASMHLFLGVSCCRDQSRHHGGSARGTAAPNSTLPDPTASK